MTAMVWPPAYSVRVSPRAKHLQLRFKRGLGLEVVVPKRYKRPPIEHLLQQHRSWIEKHLATNTQLKPVNPRIDQVDLLCVKQTWNVAYLKSASGSPFFSVDEASKTLTFSTLLCDPADARLPLSRWIRRCAVQYLPRRLAMLAQAHDFKYLNVTIRRQKTRWGSCSSKGSISLNDKLLFLPPQLADHVILHELCHTVHMNHSSQFWQLLTRVDPNALAHKKALREADKYIPDWLLN